MWLANKFDALRGRDMSQLVPYKEPRLPETFELQMFVFEKQKNHPIQSLVLSRIIPIG